MGGIPWLYVLGHQLGSWNLDEMVMVMAGGQHQSLCRRFPVGYNDNLECPEDLATAGCDHQEVY